MAAIFFDSSALVRRYDATEPGAHVVRSLCRRNPSQILVIARLTGPEIASAFGRKVREGSVTRDQQQRSWRQFRYHTRYQYRVTHPDEATYRHAEALLFRHHLRAADAVQIATALMTERVLAPVERDFRFCTADDRQRRAATAEGLAVEFIA